LALLFEAAGRQDPSALNSRLQSPDTSRELETGPQIQAFDRASRLDERSINNIPTPHSTSASISAALPSPSAETIDLWKRYRFVRQGWLTALEAVQYVDLYVQFSFRLSCKVNNYLERIASNNPNMPKYKTATYYMQILQQLIAALAYPTGLLCPSLQPSGPDI
jgi:hypothetical protein